MEFIFNDIRKRLSGEIDILLRTSPFFSNGLINRLLIAGDAWLRQESVTHITGDINFALLGVRKKSALLTILDCGFIHKHSGAKGVLLRKLWLEWPVRHARKITTISESVKEEIIRLTGCAPEKIVVIPVAISDSFYPSESEFNESRPRILHVGTAPNKNLERLVAACCGVSCRLVIIGVIPTSIQRQLSIDGIEYENHEILSQAEVVHQYNKCDLLSFVSTYEGFGMPILEAQRVGRPVVTSNLSSMPEVAGRAACLVDPFDVKAIRDGIMRVVSDEEYRKELVALGNENVRRFEPCAIANQYLDVYKYMLDELSSPTKSQTRKMN